MHASVLRLVFAPLLSGVMLIGTGLLSPIAAQGTACSEFDSQVWAQSIYDTDPAAYAVLDPDGNGLACEELARGAAPAWWTNELPAGAQLAELISVTDGDTIRVQIDGVVEPVQLILIDSPESSNSDVTPECYGEEATVFLAALLGSGGTLYLESDVSDRDQEGRLLRYAWLDFGDGYVYQVNEAMVRSGFAAAASVPPDVKYEAEMWAAAGFASEHWYGLWSGCVTDNEGNTDALY
jgi:endonuclease YncB( thermonuclease family)